MLHRLRSLVLLALVLGTLSVVLAQQSRKTKPEKATGVVPALRQAGPTYWKGNLHTHSLWSDGDDFPEMIADWYKRHDYHFLALTDHNVLSEGERWMNVNPEKQGEPLRKYLARFGEHWVERRTVNDKAQVRLKPLAEFRSLLEDPARFLLIPGEEITHSYSKFPVHMNAINLRDVVKPINGGNVQETIAVNHRQVDEQRKRTTWRTFVSLNHPNYGWGVRAEDMIPVEELRFFEIFNGHPGVRNYGDDTHAGCERVWDIVLAQRLGKHRLPIVYGLATDDAHGYHVYGVGSVNPGRGWVMVKAPYLSAEAMVRAMEAGEFYSTSGVTLKDMRRNGSELTISIQGEVGVRYKTQFIATLRDAPLDSEPHKSNDGQPLPVTRVYSPEIGKVVAESDALQSTYRLTGQELYVRVRVTSTKPHPNPFQKGDVEMAWTQPVQP